MLSRSLARISTLRTPLAGFLACAILLATAPAAEARGYLRTADHGDSEYRGQFVSAGSVEGDVWGGEQINTPDDSPEGTPDGIPDGILVKLDDPAPYDDSPPFAKASSWTRFWIKLASLLRHFGL